MMLVRACLLELSYRLTYAITMAEVGADPERWEKPWCRELHSCAQQMKKALNNAKDIDADLKNVLVVQVNKVVRGITQRYRELPGDISTMDMAVAAYRLIAEPLRAIAAEPAFKPTGLADIITLGRQLALNDLMPRLEAMGKMESYITVNGEPEGKPASTKSISRWPNWPLGDDVNKVLARYINNRLRLACPDPFSMGALVPFVQAVLSPGHFPSVVWCWQDWESGGPWHVLLAERVLTGAKPILVRHKNDKEFIVLLEAMNKDKRAGLPVEECGWMRREQLWPHMKANTRVKAWGKLIEGPLAAMGAFMTKGGAGQNKGIGGGSSRAPEALAGPDYRIFIEYTKPSANQTKRENDSSENATASAATPN